MPSGEIDNARPAGPRLYDYIIILITVTIWGGSFASTKYALAQACLLYTSDAADD